MNKVIKFSGVAALVGTIFGAGTLVGASSDWKTEVITEASKEIGATGYQTKEELLSDPSAIADSMKQSLQPTIKQEQEELARLLEEYYQMKLNGLTETDDYKEIEERITTIRENIYLRYTEEIDAMFEGL